MRYLLPFFCSMVLFASCSQADPDIPEKPVRDKSLPEKVETEIMGMLAKDWGALLDTVKYFNKNLLLKGKQKGYGPDGVYYELRTEYTVEEMTLRLHVNDSLFVTARGSIYPVNLAIDALDTNIGLHSVGTDSLGLSLGKIEVTAPLTFLVVQNHTAPLFYEKSRVGYISREFFEKEDFSTGSCFVIHYDNDPRTFAFDDDIF